MVISAHSLTFISLLGAQTERKPSTWERHVSLSHFHTSTQAVWSLAEQWSWSKLSVYKFCCTQTSCIGRWKGGVHLLPPPWPLCRMKHTAALRLIGHYTQTHASQKLHRLYIIKFSWDSHEQTDTLASRVLWNMVSCLFLRHENDIGKIYKNRENLPNSFQFSV